DQFTQPVPGDPDKIGVYVGEKPGSGSLQPTSDFAPGTQPSAQTTEHVKAVGSGGVTVPAVKVNPTKLYVPVPKSTWQAWQTTHKSIAGQGEGTARTLLQPGVVQPQI